MAWIAERRAKRIALKQRKGACRIAQETRKEHGAKSKGHREITGQWIGQKKHWAQSIEIDTLIFWR
jgi:hypothetical protein